LEAQNAHRNLIGEVRARLLLEERLSPRTLPLKIQEAIQDALRGFPNRTATVESYVQDAEAAYFAEQLIECLRSSGFTVKNEIASGVKPVPKIDKRGLPWDTRSD
jgi:hypothetical protein